MLTFLKKLGADILKGAQIWAGFAPVIAALSPANGGVIQTVSTDLSALASLVVSAEAFGQAAGLTGPQRAQFLAPQIAQILLQSTVFTGKKIANPTKFLADSQALGGVLADLLNDVSPDAIQTTQVPT